MVVETNPKKKKVRTKRCFECRKRLGLLPFKCKCGELTCDLHSWPNHQCTYNYRDEDVEQAPRVAPEKLLRI